MTVLCIPVLCALHVRGTGWPLYHKLMLTALCLEIRLPGGMAYLWQVLVFDCV